MDLNWIRNRHPERIAQDNVLFSVLYIYIFPDLKSWTILGKLLIPNHHSTENSEVGLFYLIRRFESCWWILGFGACDTHAFSENFLSDSDLVRHVLDFLCHRLCHGGSYGCCGCRSPSRKDLHRDGGLPAQRSGACLAIWADLGWGQAHLPVPCTSHGRHHFPLWFDCTKYKKCFVKNAKYLGCKIVLCKVPKFFCDK